MTPGERALLGLAARRVVRHGHFDCLSRAEWAVLRGHAADMTAGRRAGIERAVWPAGRPAEELRPPVRPLPSSAGGFGGAGHLTPFGYITDPENY